MRWPLSMAGLAIVFVPLTGALAQGGADIRLDSGHALSSSPPAMRHVQVIGIADAIVRPPPAVTGSQRPAPGSQNLFCLVDTGGGAVRLSVTSLTRANASRFEALAADGTAVRYVLQIEALALGLKADFNSAESTFDLPPGAAAPSAAACGAGNMRKTLTFISGEGPRAGPSSPQKGKIYVDTLSIIASPL